MPVYEEKNKNRWTKDGRKYYYSCYYTDMFGNRKKKHSEMFKSRPAAKRAEDDFLLHVANRDKIDFDIRFETVFYEWLEFKRRTVKASTYYSIDKKTTKNILSFFRNYKLHNIKIVNVNNFINHINQTFSNGYKNLLISYFKQLLTYAHNYYEFDMKVVASIILPKNEVIREKLSDAEINCWSYEEFFKFIDVVDDVLYKKIFIFLFFTGLRKGEMFALTWNDINFEDESISITKTLSKNKGTGTYIITSPKTKNSIRTIDLDNNLLKLLYAHYNSEKNLYNFNDKMFIFGNVKPIKESTLEKKLTKYANLAGVKRITPHGFRHSHATMLLQLGASIRQVADRLGDKEATIEKNYYHVLKKSRSNTVKIINKFIENEKIVCK